MRIGMILDESFPPDVRVENEIDALLENGFEVLLLVISQQLQPTSQPSTQSITVIYRPINKLLYKLSALAYLIPIYHWICKKRVSNFILEQDIDIVHCHDIRIGQAVKLACKKTNREYILDLHENRPEIMKHYSHVNSGIGKFLIRPNAWKKAEESLISNSLKTIVVTEQARDYYQEVYHMPHGKFCIVPNTVRKTFYTKFDIENSITERYSENFVLLYIGDTGHRRGLDVAFRGIRELKTKIPNIKLVILGQSSNQKSLIELSKELGIEDQVDFEGWVQPSLFQSYISSSDLGICPLRRNIHHDTTYANKLFQYLSFGKPIVVSNCTAQEKLAVRYEVGLIHDEQDHKGFSNCVIKYAEDKDYYQRHSDNAVNAIENELKWEELSKSLPEMYSTLR